MPHWQTGLPPPSAIRVTPPTSFSFSFSFLSFPSCALKELSCVLLSFSGFLISGTCLLLSFTQNFKYDFRFLIKALMQTIRQFVARKQSCTPIWTEVSLHLNVQEERKSPIAYQLNSPSAREAFEKASVSAGGNFKDWAQWAWSPPSGQEEREKHKEREYVPIELTFTTRSLFVGLSVKPSE